MALDSKSGFVVRLAGPQDLAALSVLFNDYRTFYWQAGDLPLASSFLAERLQLRDSVIFVASAGAQELAGFTQLYPTFSSVSARRAWILNDLFVAPDWRQRGVAKALMQQALEHARASGAAWISLQTARDNLPAQSLYRSLGFVPDEYYLSFSHAF
ncbi:GNAT family N-acetyltransferase [Azohydromonas australica]|uniref:GNAT family N-acetyltransferase n=1 Tax=Azohydromonas australica TaxID=364039 RepID=UPI0005BE4D74|nr:GNAT family N-acetyltransferase [Azohydromonas australica]